MGKDSSKVRGEILIMQKITIGQKNEILPIEWKKYEGEDVCINMTIRKGERIPDIKFFEDKEVIGEITIVIKGIQAQKEVSFNKNEIKKELNELIKAGLSLSSASKYLAKKYGLKKARKASQFSKR